MTGCEHDSYSMSGEARIVPLDTFCVCLSLWGWGWGLGVEGGWTPLPTRPQQYCEPTSLVEI